MSWAPCSALLPAPGAAGVVVGMLPGSSLPGSASFLPSSGAMMRAEVREQALLPSLVSSVLLGCRGSD